MFSWRGGGAGSDIDEIDEAGVTAVMFSEEGYLDVSIDFACGVVIIGRSRRINLGRVD